MSFVEAIVACYSKFAVFEGRARPSEFWYFVLFQILSLVVLIAFALGLKLDGGAILVPFCVWAVATYIPRLSAQIRRLHDAGYTGFLILFAFIGVGIIPMIVCMFSGTCGPNRYGPDPDDDPADPPGADLR